MDGDTGLGNGSAGRKSADRVWPADETRIPDWIYTDQDVYEREIEKIFLGRHWNYVGSGLRSAGSGQLYAVLCGTLSRRRHRDMDGEIHVFENRCAIAASNSAANTGARQTASSARTTTGPTILKAT